MNDYAARLPYQLLSEDPDQVQRLTRFRRAHPHVIIQAAEFSTWQARIPEENGETVTSRYTLRELLDRLDQLTGGPGKDLRHHGESARLVRPDGDDQLRTRRDRYGGARRGPGQSRATATSRRRR